MMRGRMINSGDQRSGQTPRPADVSSLFCHNIVLPRSLTCMSQWGLWSRLSQSLRLRFPPEGGRARVFSSARFWRSPIFVLPVRKLSRARRICSPRDLSVLPQSEGARRGSGFFHFSGGFLWKGSSSYFSRTSASQERRFSDMATISLALLR